MRNENKDVKYHTARQTYIMTKIHNFTHQQFLFLSNVTECSQTLDFHKINIMVFNNQNYTHRQVSFYARVLFLRNNAHIQNRIPT
jgi:hypothetical protein